MPGETETSNRSTSAVPYLYPSILSYNVHNHDFIYVIDIRSYWCKWGYLFNRIWFYLFITIDKFKLFSGTTPPPPEQAICSKSQPSPKQLPIAYRWERTVEVLLVGVDLNGAISNYLRLALLVPLSSLLIASLCRSINVYVEELSYMFVKKQLDLLD